MERERDGVFCQIISREGRAVPDLTITEINLFHIREPELRI